MESIWSHDTNFQRVAALLQQKSGRLYIVGPWQGCAASFFAELSVGTGNRMVIILPDIGSASEFARDLRFFTSETGKAILLDSYTQNEPVERDDSSGTVILFPEPPDRQVVHDDEDHLFMVHFSSSLNALRLKESAIAVIPARCLAVRLPAPHKQPDQIMRISQGDRIELMDLIRKLAETGYQRNPRVEAVSEFAFRGGILDLFIPDYKMPIRLEFFGNEVVSIREFDPLTQRSISRVNRISVTPVQRVKPEGDTVYFYDWLSRFYSQMPPVVWVEPERCRDLINTTDSKVLDTTPSVMGGNPELYWDIIEPASSEEIERVEITNLEVPSFAGDFRNFVVKLTNWLDTGYCVRIIYHKESMRRLIEERLAEAEIDSPVVSRIGNRRESAPVFMPGHISKGFRLPHQKYVFLSEIDIIGAKKLQKWRPPSEEQGLSFKDLKPGDLVVHIDHGIGQYQGLHRLVIDARPRDFLLLLYAENQKLYLPVDRMDLVQRYVTFRGDHPVLDRMGGVTFRNRKQKVKENVLKLAAELLKLFSAREIIEGFSFPSDDGWQREFELGFEYEETPDQLKAIEEVKSDMENIRPMDRLVCGDVGYGKTEVAMRAAFKAAISGKQVAILAPTTILVQQHFNTFSKRFRTFPVRISMLSRFLKPQETQKVKKELESGNVEVVIGTHALLSDSVKFKDLGLLIVDEEHRFGVKHKERLKQLRMRVDVLTLTATPIPRTLNLAMLGLRDISLINTPPEARKPIVTRVVKFDLKLIRQAILEELNREGQVYFVHNRVQSINALADMLKKLIPEARIEVAHGQMNDSELERIMMRFMEKEFDVLVSTTIIESGLDIPTVNTIIINRADRLGLAQLYQLRGRVGRERAQAYAYLLVPASTIVDGKAKERLKAIKEATELGSGFKLATRDLEIRGAGDILGANQHGQISAVGFEMYCSLIKEAIRELKGEFLEDIPECEIKLPLETAIPDDFVSDPAQRLVIYRQFATIQKIEDIDYIGSQIQDEFGELPEQIRNLKLLSGIRIRARKLRIEKIELGGAEVKFLFREDTPVKPETITGLILQTPGRIRFSPPNLLKLMLGTHETSNPGVYVEQILDRLL